MSKPSGATIDERVRRFAESVRNGEQGFKPGDSWWLVRRTSKSSRNYKEAVTLCDQLGISEQEMGNHLNNTRWVGLIGDSLYTDYLIAVELAGAVLLVATIGAIALAQRPAENLS